MARQEIYLRFEVSFTHHLTQHLFPLTGSTQAQVYKQVLRGGSLTFLNDGCMEEIAQDLMSKVVC